MVGLKIQDLDKKMGEYKKNAGASPVITMLDNLITDAVQAETEAINSENDAIAEYGKLVTESGSRAEVKAPTPGRACVPAT